MSPTNNLFTLKAPGPLSELRSYITVANPSMSSIAVGTMAVWDTGSPLCFISRKMMTALGLKFESEIAGHGIFGEGSTQYGKVAIRLVSKGRFFDVMAGVVENLHRGEECQALIGMNLIGLGQLSLSFRAGISTFSFAIPAITSSDLVDTVVSNDISAEFDYYNFSDDT